MKKPMKSPFAGLNVGDQPFFNLNNTFAVMYKKIKPKDLPLFKQQFQTAYDMLKKQKRIK